MRLKNKVAVITGGNSGIGLSIARAFVKEGARVVLTGRNAKSLAEASSTVGGSVLTVVSDVSKVDSIDAIYAETTAKLGKIDILVVNAGIAHFTPAGATTEESFDQLSDINFKGAFFTVSKATPHFNPGASVILVGSGVATRGMSAFSVYSATKAAVRSLARSFSADLLPQGVRVNVLSPGPIETPIFGKMGMTQEQMTEMGGAMAASNPMKRFGKPEEMARAAVFLASDDSSYMAGADLVADGGWSQL